MAPLWQRGARGDLFNGIPVSANVIGEITGSEFPDEIVSIGAHLDSWDVGTGALDDGMGVAMMLASAHHIAQLPERPKRTIRVILFAAEEVGLLGAKEYMKIHKDNMDNHIIGAEWDFGVGKIYKMRKEKKFIFFFSFQG